MNGKSVISLPLGPVPSRFAPTWNEKWPSDESWQLASFFIRNIFLQLLSLVCPISSRSALLEATVSGNFLCSHSRSLDSTFCRQYLRKHGRCSIPTDSQQNLIKIFALVLRGSFLLLCFLASLPELAAQRQTILCHILRGKV